MPNMHLDEGPVLDVLLTVLQEGVAIERISKLCLLTMIVTFPLLLIIDDVQVDLEELEVLPS